MEDANFKGLAIVKRIYKDLQRGDDPRISWEATEQYLEMLTWIRTLLGFSATVGAVFCLIWIYTQLRQTPIQNFLQECQQRDTPSACVDRWNKSHPRS